MQSVLIASVVMLVSGWQSGGSPRGELCRQPKLTLALACSRRPPVREGDRGPDGLDEKCAGVPRHRREGEALRDGPAASRHDPPGPHSWPACCLRAAGLAGALPAGVGAMV